MMTQQGLHAGSVARGGRNCSAAPGTWCAERGPRSRYHIFSRKNREDALSHPRVWLTLMPAYAGRAAFLTLGRPWRAVGGAMLGLVLQMRSEALRRLVDTQMVMRGRRGVFLRRQFQFAAVHELARARRRCNPDRA